jgi:Flp pilus assembly protein TadG
MPVPSRSPHSHGTRALLLRLRGWARDRKAAMAAEFALVLPLFLLLLIGTTEFGITLSNYVMMNYAAITGAQLFSASANSTAPTCPGSTLCTPYTNTVNAVKGATVGLNWASAPSGASINLCVATTGACTSSNACGYYPPLSTTADATCVTALTTASNTSPPGSVTVAVSYPCSLSLPKFYGTTPPCNLYSAVTEPVQ